MAGKLYVFAFVCGLVAVVFGARQLDIVVRWRAVDADVVSGRIIQDVSEDSRHKTSKPIFRPEIVFRYQVDGVPQTGRGVASFWSTDRADAAEILAAFPAGSRRKIRVHPSAHEEVRFDALSFAGFKVPLIAALAAIAAWIAARVLARRFAPSVIDVVP